MSTETIRRRSPWVLAIVIGLSVVAIVNAIFIYVAVRNQDPVVATYDTGPR
jgi:hypothetical protein